MQSYVISENNALLSELCAGARNVASDVTAVVFGDGAAAAECGADHILTCPLEESGSPEDFAKAIAEEILKSLLRQLLQNLPENRILLMDM